MPDNDKVKLLFLGLQNKLSANLGLSSVLDDPNAKGDNSEISWREMLSKCLPSRYKVDAGIVIDSNGSQSDSIDIIIYDSFYSPYVFNENGVIYVPAESVYAVIECKQELDKGYIEYAAKKAASVRKLERTSIPVTQINGEQIAKVDKGIIAGIFTTSSTWNPPFGESFNSALTEFQNISKLDFGCCLNNGAFTIIYDEAKPIVNVSGSDDVLICLYLDLLTELQNLGNSPAIDLKKYYRTATQS